MKRSLFGALAIILMSAVPSFGQFFVNDSLWFEDFQLNFFGGGARAQGMGNAFLAVSDDVFGGSWNSAGIVNLEGPILGITYGSLMPRGSADYIAIGIDGSAFGGTDQHEGTFGNVSSLNFAAPIRISGHPFVSTVSYVRRYDEYQKYAFRTVEPFITFVLNEAGALVLDTLDASANLDMELTGGMNSLSLGFGTRIFKKLSLGIAANVYSGEAVRRSDLLLTADSVSVAAFQRAYVTLDTLWIDTNKFSGFNFSVGFKLDGEKLDAALMIRTPFSLNIKRGTSIYNQMTINGFVSGENTDTVFIDNQLVKYSMPLMIAAGFALQAKENLLFAADFEFRGYSSTRIKNRYDRILDPGGTDLEFFNEYDPSWRNTFQFHLGAERTFQTSWAKIPLRIGFGYEPIAASSLEFGENGVVRKTNSAATKISGGTGLAWEQINLDLAYTYTKLSHSVSAGSAFGADMKIKNHKLTFSFTGYF